MDVMLPSRVVRPVQISRSWRVFGDLLDDGGVHVPADTGLIAVLLEIQKCRQGPELQDKDQVGWDNPCAAESFQTQMLATGLLLSPSGLQG